MGSHRAALYSKTIGNDYLAGGLDETSSLIRIMDDRIFFCPIRELQNQQIVKYKWLVPISDAVSQNLCTSSSTCHGTDFAGLFKGTQDSLAQQQVDRFRDDIANFVRGKGVSWGSNTTYSLPNLHPKDNIAKCFHWKTAETVSSRISKQSDQVFMHSGYLILTWYILTLFLAAQAVTAIFNSFRTSSMRLRLKFTSGSNEDNKRVIQALGEIVKSHPNPVTVSTKSLCYNIEEKEILNNISLVLNPYTMTALIGPSGSGKTTLMSLLARQWTCKTAQGMISYGKVKLSDIKDGAFKRMISFVAQYDPPYFGLTPREVLAYNARLELGDHSKVIAQKVEHIILLMGLSGCENTVIRPAGMQGLSGGQMRRLSIAISLVKQPSVLFLDEPTSGLDSQSALEIMQVLANLAEAGYTILVSIHQPRQEVFGLFHQVVLLARGNLVYAGPPMNCLHCISVATKNINSDVQINTADAIIDLAATISADDVVHVGEKCQKWVEARFMIPDLSTLPLNRFEVSRPSFLSQVVALNARWWNTRPIMRKLTSLLLPVFGTLFLSILQRRVSIDAVGLVLQVKGLAIGMNVLI